MKSRALSLCLTVLLSTCLLSPVWAKPKSKEIGADLLTAALRELLHTEPFEKNYKAPKPPEAKEISSLAESLRSRYRLLEDRLALPGSQSPLTEKESAQLLRLLKADPDWLDSLGVYLPRTPEYLEWAAKQFDGPEYCPEWLVANYPPYRADLVKRASTGGGISLQALVIVDWPAAQPLVERALKSDRYVEGLRAQVLHPPSADVAGAALLKVVKDPQQDVFHRSWAAEALFDAGYDQRYGLFEWMIEQPIWYQDGGSLVDAFDGYLCYYPDAKSRLLPLLKDRRPVVRRNVACILCRFVEGEDPDQQVLRALVPSLSDTDWLKAVKYQSTILIEATGKVKVPEAVPALLHILRSGDADRLEAAKALETYRPPGFRAAWEEACKKIDIGGSELARVGVRQGWYTVDDQVAAVAQYLLKRDNLDSHGYDWGETPQDHLALASFYDQPEAELGRGLAGLARSWYTDGRPQLQELEERLLEYSGKAIDDYLLDRIEMGDVSADFLRRLLERGDAWGDGGLSKLKRMTKDAGPASGVALVILADSHQASQALAEDDRQRSLAILACARIVGMPLSATSLREAYRVPGLEKAVVSYLETSEEPVQMKLLESLQSDYIVTGRTTGDRVIQEQERELIARYRAKGKGELYALQTYHEGHTIYLAGAELWVDGDHAELIFENNKLRHLIRDDDAPSYERRVVGSEELTAFRSFILEKKVDTWPKWVHVTSHHATCYQYLHLTSEGGRRVAVIYNFPDGPGEKYGELIDLFQQMKEKPSETVYQLQKDLPGFKVIDDHSEAMAICDDPEGLKVREKDWRGKVTWRLLTDSGLGAVTSPAEGYEASPPEGTFSSRPTALAEGEFLTNDLLHLIVRRPNERPTTFLDGAFGWIVLDAERRQALAVQSKSGTREGDWQHLLINFFTGDVREVDIPVGSEARPLAYLPGRQAYLSVARDADYELINKGYVVDATGGNAIEVQGDFRPWEQPDARPLQSAGDGRYWTTVQTPLGTEIGIVDENTLAYQAVAHYPGLQFNANQMWIQGDHAVVTVGDVLSLPLKGGKPL